ncbi:MAG: YceI family protein [Acidimicrobiales bacterium]
MAITSGKYKIGPEDGRLVMLTTRKGAAAAMGHDLTIEAKSWSGTVVVDTDDPSNSSVSISIDTSSLFVASGKGGAKALSDGDKAKIKASMDDVLKTRTNSTMTFESSSVSANGTDSAKVDGTLTVVGKSGPASVNVTIDDSGRAKAKATITQSNFGIKPFSAMMGALKLADDVGLEVDAALQPS